MRVLVLALGLLPLATANVFFMCAKSDYVDSLEYINQYSADIDTQSRCDVSWGS